MEVATMPTVIPLRDHQRSRGLDLLDLIDHELRMMSTLICVFEQARRLAADLDDATDLLLSHYTRLQSIQKLALQLHERAIAPVNSPPL
jgi:hypothetical protein